MTRRGPVPLACPIRKLDSVAPGTSRRQSPEFLEIIAGRSLPASEDIHGDLLPS